MNPHIDRSAAARAQRYEHDHARRLRALAYRMLGSRADAEDVVQEAWLRWERVDESSVQHAGAFLSRMVTRLCLDRLRSAAAQREHYVGVWLPEPLLEDQTGWSPDPQAQAEFAQDVSVAFMLALERLSPLERAAFLLHEVFEMEFDEIARHLRRSAAACRQLASRARQHVKADDRRREVQHAEQDRLFSAFAAAVRDLDVQALAKVLAEDAVMLADGGGRVSALPRPLHGAALIADTLVAFARLPANGAWRLAPARINGLSGCLVFDAASGRLIQTIALAASVSETGRIGAIYVQRNPDKLRGVAAALGVGDVTTPRAESS